MTATPPGFNPSLLEAAIRLIEATPYRTEPLRIVLSRADAARAVALGIRPEDIVTSPEVPA